MEFKFYRYDEMLALLEGWATTYPDLCCLTPLTASSEGRQVWLVTLGKGDDRAKPGYYLDANQHAGEVTGNTLALYTIKRLLEGYGSDPTITTLLNTRAIYVIPRIAVDGAEAYLTSPYYYRSSPKLYPYPEEREGLHPEDLDGDGVIRQMRVVDPSGPWKVSDKDSRLLVRRQPEDQTGTFYRVFTEGLVKEHGGQLAAAVTREVVEAPRRHGLDFNRNYPYHWRPHSEQPGTGPYPLSEPETRAVADFLVRHPNLSIYVSLHTYGGIFLHPLSDRPDEKLPRADRELFVAMGRLATAKTGYVAKSNYDTWVVPGDKSLVYGADDWAYEQLGVAGFTLELWNPEARAGARDYPSLGLKGLAKRTPAEIEEDELKLLAWNDAELAGQGFLPWTPFEHPQLGPVEIGGWDYKYVLQNAPLRFLQEECEKNFAFLLAHAQMTPLLAIEKVEVTPLAPGCYKVAARIVNQGYMNTAGTAQAVERKQAKPVKANLAGATVVAGKPTQELGHLAGFGEEGGRAAWAEWVITAAAGAKVTVTAETPRAGKVSETVVLAEPGA